MSENPDYSSRNRWLGPTPQILFWKLTGSCPLLDFFGNYYRPPSTPAKTFMTLRPVKEWDLAEKQDRVFKNFAVLLENDDILGGSRVGPLGFSIEEQTAAFGGADFIQESCNNCPLNSQKSTNGLTGCCGILPESSSYQMHLSTKEQQAHSFPLPAPNWSDPNWQIGNTLTGSVKKISTIIDSTEAQIVDLNQSKAAGSKWNQLLAKGSFKSEQARKVAQHLTAELNNKLLESATPPQSGPMLEVNRFALACLVAGTEGTEIHWEVIPAGFSDGIDWWIGPHCGQCFSPMGKHQEGCGQCGKSGGPVPLKKRRIMGWSPYWPLHSIVDKKLEQDLVSAARKKHEQNPGS